MRKAAIVLFLVGLCVFAAEKASPQAHQYELVAPGTEKWFQEEGSPVEEMRWFYPGDMIGEAYVRLNEYYYDGDLFLTICSLKSVDEETVF
ncbi:MAG: hypothetical protein GF400_02970 [Candidatus Eisenbacteria bacterium]|nr:hypothetical protein [Candidatus Eisenbacteria bacterium]